MHGRLPREEPAGGAAKGGAMLPALLLAAAVPPLLAAVVLAGLWLARSAARRIDGRRRPAPAAAPPRARLDEPELLPGPLQLVGDRAPSTRLCPRCAEVLPARAGACRHCHLPLRPAAPRTAALRQA